jgi:hypothetical protein
MAKDKVTSETGSNQERTVFEESYRIKAINLVDSCNCEISVLQKTFEFFGRDDESVEANLILWDGLAAICKDMVEKLMEAHDIVTDKLMDA